MSNEDKKDAPETENAEDEIFETEADLDAGEEALVDPIEALTKENAELKDRILRTMAEMENVRRRAEKDKVDASAYAVTAFARDILNVSDNLSRAMQAAPAEIAEDVKGIVEGVEMTERELINTLERHGIKQVVPAEGDKFNPKLHQAMFEVPTPEGPSGLIMNVVAPGYVIKDRLLRPAMVGVSKGEAPKKVDETA